MLAKAGGWLLALAVAAIVAAVVPEDLFPAARAFSFAILFLVLGGIVEFIQIDRSPSTLSLLDPRPADGRIDLAALTAVRNEPNLHDPRFAQFLAIKPSTSSRPPPRDRNSPLRGRVVLVSLFIGQDNRPWPDSEIAAAHQSLERAGRWLEREALRHRAPLNIELADTYFTFDDASPQEVAVAFQHVGDNLGPAEEGAEEKSLIQATRAAVHLGFQDAADMVASIESRIHADAVAWLVHPRQAGRSFAIPQEQSALQGVSLAVCYPREASFPEPLSGPPRVDPITVVHELLHLFGATDKYGRSLKAFPPRSVSRSDVMRLSLTRLSKLTIDPATAFEIGWRDPPNPGAKERPVQTKGPDRPL